MNAYRTFVTVKDPRRIVLENVPFEPGQRVEVVVLEDLAVKELFRASQAHGADRGITAEDIQREIDENRAGR